MSWEKVKLGEVCTSISDGDHQPPPKTNFGIPFVTISNITSTNQFDFSDTMFVPQEYYDKLDTKRKAKTGDILYSVVGSFGIPVLIKNDDKFAFQRHIAILRPNTEKINSEFLYYTMLSRDFYMQADSVALGAAQRTVSLTALRNMVIDIPPLETQQKIASILSAYDNLIENNQKQIKLLEEAAQRLYKEWFVDLRFPGFESTEIVDGVPWGWKKGSITDISICYDKKRKPLSSMERSKQEKNYPYYGAASLMDYVENYIFDGVYLLFGEDGTVITNEDTPMLQYVWGKFWVNNHAHVFQGKDSFSTEFLYMLCKHMKVNDIVTGVAQPKISQGRLNDKEILIPDIYLAERYSKITNPIFKRIRALNDEIRICTESRDRLLPKLMSGEIEV